MEILVSGVSKKGEKRIAYVMFQEGECVAEAIIPDCQVISNKGFSEQEICQCEQYLRENLVMLKNQAAQINPIKAMMKE